MTPEPKSIKGPTFRWQLDVLVEVAREEQRLVGLHVHKINVELQKMFPSRTLHAIKGMRRHEKYKDVLRSLAAPPPT